MHRTTVVDVALRVASCPVAGLDVPRLLTDVSRDLTAVLDVAAVVVLIPEAGWVGGSDGTAALVGDLQLRAAAGLLWTAVHSAAPVSTTDLTREDPQELARLAADVGLAASAAAPLVARGRAVGAVQVLGAVGQSVTAHRLAPLEPALAVLAARVLDVLEMHDAALIERATGILAERHGTTVADAARTLRELADAAGQSVTEAAIVVLAGAGRPVPAPRMARSHSVPPVRHDRRIRL